jgi:hypothetical protein
MGRQSLLVLVWRGPWAGPDIGKSRPFQETESEIQERTGSLVVLGRDLVPLAGFLANLVPGLTLVQPDLNFTSDQDPQAT